MENLRIVVAGHIDHGKSTLIGRLLYETNCLPQNVKENIEKSEALGCKERFAFVTDQLEEALVHLQEAQSIAEAPHQPEELSRVHSLRGNLLFPRGEFEASVKPTHGPFDKPMVPGCDV